MVPLPQMYLWLVKEVRKFCNQLLEEEQPNNIRVSNRVGGVQGSWNNSNQRTIEIKNHLMKNFVANSACSFLVYFYSFHFLPFFKAFRFFSFFMFSACSASRCHTGIKLCHLHFDSVDVQQFCQKCLGCIVRL